MHLQPEWWQAGQTQISLSTADSHAHSSSANCPRAEAAPRTELSSPRHPRPRAGHGVVSTWPNPTKRGLTHTILRWTHFFGSTVFLSAILLNLNSCPEAELGFGHKAYVPSHSAAFPGKIRFNHQLSWNQDVFQKHIRITDKTCVDCRLFFQSGPY